jgi:hypothetical protein
LGSSAGHDPLQLFKEHPGRFKMWHVKDMDKVNPDWNAEMKRIYKFQSDFLLKLN